MTSALILAGQRPEGQDALAGHLDVPHKAFLPLAGQPMLTYVLEALAAAGLTDVTISAPGALHGQFKALAPDASLVESQVTPARSVSAALEAIGGDTVFVTTSDHPLLNSAMITQLLGQAQAHDVAAACVTEPVFRACYPQAKRTFIRLRGFAFSGANMFVMRKPGALGLVRFWRTLEDKRKNPLAMARMIGLGTGLKYMTRQLTREGLLRKLEAKTEARCCLIALEDANAAIDIDKPSDIALVESIMRA